MFKRLQVKTGVNSVKLYQQLCSQEEKEILWFRLSLAAGWPSSGPNLPQEAAGGGDFGDNYFLRGTSPSRMPPSQTPVPRAVLGRNIFAALIKKAMKKQPHLVISSVLFRGNV